MYYYSKMNPDDIKKINNIYVKILKDGLKIYDIIDNDNNTIQNAKKLESYSTYLSEMNEKLEHILNISNKYVNECLDKATEIREYVDLNDKYKHDKFPIFSITKELNKNIIWADVVELEDKKNNLLHDVKKITEDKTEYNQKNIMYKNIENEYKYINFKYQIPIINRLDEIPQSLYWYKGDKDNPKGIYTSLSPGFYVQVPFPDVIDGTKDFNRICSIKCKYNTIDECLKIRQDLSNKFNSDIRVCNFAHKGENYTKIGTSFRCPNIPRFGNHNFLNTDLENLPHNDMKMLLMYSLSDMMLSSMWFQKKQLPNMVLTKIDTC